MSAAGASNGESEVTEEPAETVTVEAPEPEEEGAETAPAAGLSEEQRASRKERRANKMREERERADASDRRAQEISDRLARSERETAELRGFVAAQAQQQRSGDPEAAIKGRVTALRREAQVHLERTAAFSRAGQHDQAQAEMDLYHDKIDEAREVRRAPQREADLNRRISEVAGRIPSPEIQMAREKIISEFPFVRDDLEARAMVDVKFEALKAAGRPATFDTVREAAAAVAKRLGIGGRQAPSQESRQRMQAVPSGEGAGGGEGSVQIVMGEKEKKLAHAAYRHLEPKEAEKAAARDWAAAKRAGTWDGGR